MKKAKKTEPKYATYGQLVDELAKFDQKDPACITASAGEDENVVDGSGVKSVCVASGVVKITCGDSGTMTWGQIRDRLRAGITLDMADQPAIVQIGYRGMTDFNDEPCRPRWAKACAVLGGDMLWDVELGPEI